jgi:hypothetical protein
MRRAWSVLALLSACSFTPGAAVRSGDDDAAVPPDVTIIHDAPADGAPDAAPSDATSPPIAFVQSANRFANTQTTIALAFPGAQLSHSLNVVIIGWINTHTVTSVHDATGNTYLMAGARVTQNGMHQEMYYSCDAAGTATNTVTVVLDSSAQADLRIVEYSGARTTACLDQIASNTGNTTNLDSGTATTTYYHELAVASDTTFRTTTAADPTFTNRGITSFGDVVEDRELSATGMVHATATQDQTGDWVMQVATFFGK